MRVWFEMWEIQPTVIEWEQKISQVDHSDNEVILPLVLYLSIARLWKDGNKKSVKKGVFGRTEAYSHCLDVQHGLDIAIDLSLHPTWQKRIIGILKELFPKIQFICATHSPFIIQSLEEGELITLDQPLDSEYSGEGLEDIAEDIMGVVLPQYSEKSEKYMKHHRNKIQQGCVTKKHKIHMI